MIFDSDTFEATFLEFGKDTLKELLLAFLDDYPSKLVELRGKIESHDFAEIRFSAHSFKNLCVAIYATDSAMLAEEIEEAAKKEDIISISESFNRILDQKAELIKQIIQYNSSL